MHTFDTRLDDTRLEKLPHRPQQLVLSAINETELKNIHLSRKHKPIVLKYGAILRAERTSQKVEIIELAKRLKAYGFSRSYATISRWETGLIHPNLNIIELWAKCIGLKASVFVYADDRRLIGDTYQEKLCWLRKDKDILQSFVSKKIGIEAYQLSLWEKAKKYPNEPELKAWAIALGVEAELVIERG